MDPANICLTVDTESKEVIEKKAWLYDTNDLPSAINEYSRSRGSLYQSGKEILSTAVVGQKTIIIHRRRNFSLLLCEAVGGKVAMRIVLFLMKV